MTGFFKGRAVSQVDELLCEGKRFSLEDVCKIIREHKIEPASKSKKGKKK